MGRRWLLWTVVGSMIIWMLTPGGRFIALLPWGRWAILGSGFALGYMVAGWLGATGQTEGRLLRRRLINGEIRLSEYRLLCRELGINKKTPSGDKIEEDFSSGNGT